VNVSAKVFLGILLAFAVIGGIKFIAASADRQSQEDAGKASICRQMQATGGGSYDNCMAELKKQGY